MAGSRVARLRRFWLNVHLWIGLGLGLLLIPISVSGLLLVRQDTIDAWINPSRYAVTPDDTRASASAYLASAAAALGSAAATARPASIRYPEADGAPVIV